VEEWLPADLGGYRLLAQAGRGGLGRVFRAEERKSRAPAAVKVPAGQAGWGPEGRTRFERETRLLQSVNHPHVARLLAHGTEQGVRYCVMEWVEGTDLCELLEACRGRGEYLTFELAHVWFRQLCDALQALHDRGVAHRDVKPSNVMITTDGTLKLVDLGAGSCPGARADDITRTGAAVGTAQYQAPEQLRGAADVDHRADVFAAGLVTYEMLTNALPREEVSAPSVVNPTVPPWFDAVVLCMLEPDPSDRPPVIGPLGDVTEPPWLRVDPAPDYYGALGVAPAAEPEVIAAAYKQLAWKYHPDRNAGGSSTDRMKQMNEAYEVLSDPVRRQLYDEWRRHGAGRAGQAGPGADSPLNTAEQAAALRRGDEALAAGDYDVAAGHYGEAVRLGGEAKAFHNRGVAHARMKRYREAVADFTEAIRLDPGDAVAYRNRGRAYQALGEHESARADFDRAESLPGTPPLVPAWNLWLLALVFAALLPLAVYGMLAAAGLPGWATVCGPVSAAAFLVLNRRQVKSADWPAWAYGSFICGVVAASSLGLGRLGFLAGCVLAVVGLWLNGLRCRVAAAPRGAWGRGVLPPWRPYLVALLAVLPGFFLCAGGPDFRLPGRDDFLKAGSPEVAVAAFTGAIRADPDDPRLYGGRGKAYAEMGKHDLAVQDFSEAIRLNPGYAQAYVLRGRSHFARGEDGKAIDDFDAAVALGWKDMGLCLVRGRACLRKKEYAQALADFTFAITHDPRSGEAFAGRGEAHLARSEYDEAIADFGRALGLGLRGTGVYCNRGAAHAGKGDHDLAIADYTADIEVDPKNARAYLGRGLAYAAKGEGARAEADRAHALRLDPTLTR
jgi:tetratricopeptide (TPR) repeat protein